MQFKLRLISAVVLALFMAPQSSSAQSAPAGTRDANGRILAKVVVTMNEPGAFGRPATGLAFLLVGEDGDRVSIKTNDAGVASTWISPGEYRLVTPDPVTSEADHPALAEPVEQLGIHAIISKRFSVQERW